MVKMQKKSEGVREWDGGQGGCERRIVVIVKVEKKVGGGPDGVGWSGWMLTNN